MTLQPLADALLRRAAPVPVPHTTFAFWQDDFDGGRFPVYTLTGGPRHWSSVTAATLRRLGIAVPR
jgi:hypothetical protein